MKNYIAIIILFLFIPFFGLSQKNDPVQADTTMRPSDNEKKGRLLTFKQLDQRKIYHWTTGQRSTPSGRQADADAGRMVRVWGDSARVVDPSELPAKK